MEEDLRLLPLRRRHPPTNPSGITTMSALSRASKNSTGAASVILHRLSWPNGDTHLWRTRNDEKERNLTEIEPPTPISTEASIIAATYLIALILGVLFFALSVLTVQDPLVCARPRDVNADYPRFATRKNRAAAASLIAPANARRSHTQRQYDEASSLLRKRPHEVYMVWAAGVKVSCLGRLPADPLW
jgi:hypothetical protein